MLLSLHSRIPNSGLFPVPGPLSRSNRKLYSTNTDCIRQNKTIYQKNDLRVGKLMYADLYSKN